MEVVASITHNLCTTMVVYSGLVNYILMSRYGPLYGYLAKSPRRRSYKRKNPASSVLNQLQNAARAYLPNVFGNLPPAAGGGGSAPPTQQWSGMPQALRVGGRRKLRYGRRNKRKRARYSRRPAKYIRRYVRRVAQKVANDSDINHFKRQDSGNLSSLNNECKWQHFSLCGGDTLDARVDTARITDFNTGGGTADVVNNVDLSSSSGADYQRAITIMSASLFFRFRNNYDLPCYLEYWKLVPRKSHFIEEMDPLECFYEGVRRKAVAASLTDAQKNGLDLTLYDGGPTFHRFWKIVSHKRVLLNAGDEHWVGLYRKRPFKFHPVDDAAYYLKGITQDIVFRLYGCVCHDSEDDDKVGTGPGKLDFIYNESMKFVADINTGMQYIHREGALDTMTDPIADAPPFNADVDIEPDT